MFEALVSANSPYSSFKLFSVSHLVIIVFTIMLIAGFYKWKKPLQPYRDLIRWGLLFALIGSEIYFNVWNIVIGEWSLLYTLPFQLCSICIYLCTFMLLTKNYRLFEIVYFLGLAGATQAILTPELFYDFPHSRYFQFFIAHIAIILSPLYMTWIEGYRIRFNSVIRAFLTLNVIAAAVFLINVRLGANYMFLMRKPNNTSLLDFLGPYPRYLIALEFIAFFLFLLLYFPFYQRNSKNEVM
ncbi:YwaF family protein [Bacillus litorisediminis]|uniref:YwaF family protein n=1 Tax=Bacillus litorisediminis TaxID=2922713 RepID=UPI001FAC08A4|nr:TIGR02206 family membrane protein [Bacillus litorisediminis]